MFVVDYFQLQMSCSNDFLVIYAYKALHNLCFVPQTTTADQLLEFFKQVGDVKFVRMAGDETQPTRFAFVEFVEQDSVARALTFNGVMFGDRPLKYVFFGLNVILQLNPVAMCLE